MNCDGIVPKLQAGFSVANPFISNTKFAREVFNAYFYDLITFTSLRSCKKHLEYSVDETEYSRISAPLFRRKHAK